MKKILLTILVAVTIVLTANAQSYDGFFSTGSEGNNRQGSTVEWGALPTVPNTGTYSNQNAPLGSGLLLLTGMGVAYALRRKKE